MRYKVDPFNSRHGRHELCHGKGHRHHEETRDEPSPHHPDMTTLPCLISHIINNEPEACCWTFGPTGGLIANPRIMPSALCLDSVDISFGPKRGVKSFKFISLSFSKFIVSYIHVIYKSKFQVSKYFIPNYISGFGILLIIRKEYFNVSWMSPA